MSLIKVAALKVSWSNIANPRIPNSGHSLMDLAKKLKTSCNNIKRWQSNSNLQVISLDEHRSNDHYDDNDHYDRAHPEYS